MGLLQAQAISLNLAGKPRWRRPTSGKRNLVVKVLRCRTDMIYCIIFYTILFVIEIIFFFSALAGFSGLVGDFSSGILAGCSAIWQFILRHFKRQWFAKKGILSIGLIQAVVATWCWQVVTPVTLVKIGTNHQRSSGTCKIRTWSSRNVRVISRQAGVCRKGPMFGEEAVKSATKWWLND